MEIYVASVNGQGQCEKLADRAWCHEARYSSVASLSLPPSLSLCVCACLCLVTLLDSTPSPLTRMREVSGWRTKLKLHEKVDSDRWCRGQRGEWICTTWKNTDQVAGPTFSNPANWSVKVQVVHFPAIEFSWSVNFWLCVFGEKFTSH